LLSSVRHRSKKKAVLECLPPEEYQQKLDEALTTVSSQVFLSLYTATQR